MYKRHIFLTKGFVAASVEDIAELAGYSRGAFYSNFASKSEPVSYTHLDVDKRQAFSSSIARCAELPFCVMP